MQYVGESKTHLGLKLGYNFPNLTSRASLTYLVAYNFSCSESEILISLKASDTIQFPKFNNFQ
jgi:hypothetical protein